MRRNAFFLIPVKRIFIAILLAILSHSTAQTNHIDSLLNAVKTIKDDTLKIQTYREICKAYMMEVNDIDKVMEYGTTMLALAQKVNYKKGIGYGMFYQGVAYWSRGNYQLALEQYKKALVLMKELGIKKGENACYINIGLINTDLGNYPEALDYLKKGIKLTEEANDKQGLQIGYDNIGIVYMFQGNYTQALNYHFKALKIAEEREDELVISYAYNNIGDVFYAQNKLDIALLYYKKAIAYVEKVKDLAGIGSCYTDIGNVYWQKKQYEEALFYHTKDLKIKEEIADKQGTAIAYNKVGFDYFAQKKLKQALYYQLRSYALCKQIAFKKGIIEASGGIGNVYEAQQDYSKALLYYKEMLTIATEVDYKEGIRDAYSNHASVYKKLNEFEKALAYTKRYNTAKDSLLNKENFKQVNELNTRYETDKKEKEILLLTKDQELNTKIIRQQQLVRWSLISGLGLLSISIFSIFRRYRFKQKANVALEKQKREIEQKNILITDSIDYAKTIQDAVLPSEREMTSMLVEYFILYKPKAIVSSDFYWIKEVNQHILCAVGNCPGEGVPAAFMSLMGYNMLENAVKKTGSTDPSAILTVFNQEMITQLHKNKYQKKSGRSVHISLISINKITNELIFSGTTSSIFIIRQNELINLSDHSFDANPPLNDLPTLITKYTSLEKGDLIYLFTDRFLNNSVLNAEKSMLEFFKKLLLSICQLSLTEQKIKLNEAHQQWMGEKHAQTNDILIIGIQY